MDPCQIHLRPDPNEYKILTFILVVFGNLLQPPLWHCSSSFVIAGMPVNERGFRVLIVGTHNVDMKIMLALMSSLNFDGLRCRGSSRKMVMTVRRGLSSSAVDEVEWIWYYCWCCPSVVAMCLVKWGEWQKGKWVLDWGSLGTGCIQVVEEERWSWSESEQGWLSFSRWNRGSGSTGMGERWGEVGCLL